MPTRRIFVHGRVQGVSFRMWATDHARRLGLAGWVRNRHDGRVEMLVKGPAERITELATLCWAGPELAKVSEVEVEAADGDVPAGFEERMTV
ncbi:MAG TPA: acylphosphatase [Allosphingosinicella sp.]